MSISFMIVECHHCGTQNDQDKLEERGGECEGCGMMLFKCACPHVGTEGECVFSVDGKPLLCSARPRVRIKCPSEGVFFICRYLRHGYCSLDDVEMEFELQGPDSTSHYVVCGKEDIITNGMPEWKNFEHYRTTVVVNIDMKGRD